MKFAVAALISLFLSVSVSAAANPHETIKLDQKAPVVGDTVTFTVTNLNSAVDYRINVFCYQKKTVVFSDSHFLPGGTTDGGSFVLTWGGGSAQCDAFLVSETPAIAQEVAETGFRVGA